MPQRVDIYKQKKKRGKEGLCPAPPLSPLHFVKSRLNVGCRCGIIITCSIERVDTILGNLINTFIIIPIPI